MAKFRTILACLIAVAVAVAPVAATVVAGARPDSASAVHDCHGTALKHHHAAGCTDGAATAHHCHATASQDTEKGSCPDCDGKRQAKCLGDGGKCCQLTGMVSVLPVVVGPAETIDVAANPSTLLIGWQVRPLPPPPRT